MAAQLESSLRLLLRASDEIKFVLEAFSMKIVDSSNLDSPTSPNATPTPISPGSINAPKNSALRRIVAVVAHRDEVNGTEEGSVFIFKQKPFVTNELEIHRVFPVYGDFTISMAQMKRETLDLRASSQSSLNQQRTGLKLTISPGHALIGSEPMDLVTYDVQGLKDVLAECRRLKEISDLVPESASPTQTYSWLAPYTSSNNLYIPPLTSLFPDLRVLHKPLYTRLSAASAGIPGDDVDDLILIRDDWVRVNARNQCRQGRGRLNLRLGTFNVNGKFPSQDLATWVRGGATETLLPALKEISPLSMGEIVRNPFDSRAEEAKSNEHLPLPTSSSLSSMSYSSTSSTDTIRSRSSFHSGLSVANSPLASSTSATTITTESAEATATTPTPFSNPQDVPVVPIDPSDPSDPDLLVLGFEELDLSTEALLYSTSTVREEAWCTAIFAALGEKGEMYEKLASKQLVGMLIIVIVKKSLKDCFSHVMTSAVGSGIMGVMGNKGGTGVRLTFTPPASSLSALDAAAEAKTHDIISPGWTTLTFVVSHLAAFDEMVDRRNADFHDLCKRLVFDTSRLVVSKPDGSGGEGEEMPGAMPSSQSQMTLPEKFGVFETDVLFWMGDLNYRIDLPDSDVRTLLGSEDWKNKFEILLKYDQLKCSIRDQKAFEIFQEHPITHLPTYRFSTGILTDELGYDIKRRPAWTDRVLHTYSPLVAQVEQHSYNGHPEITMSDHRPLSAQFTLDVDLYDRHRLQATAANLFRQVHGMEDEQERSKAQVSQASVEMGDIYYQRRVIKTITFRNMGKVPCAFRFVPIEMGTEVHPEWLSISPMTGLLLPNELVEISLSAFVNNEVASHLNLGPRNLDCILILHTVLGKDHFIPVSAKYHYTCFGNRLSRLTQLPGPIRSIKDQNDLLGEERAINAPREIVRLVNWMMASSHSVDELFMAEADPNMVDSIRECLDTGDDFLYSPECKDRSILVAFGETLIQLLKSLPECLVPKELHATCAEAANRDEAFEVLGSFPPASVNVWISVTAFLHFLVQSSPKPEVKANKIAAIFAPVFFELPPTSSSSPPPSMVTPLGYGDWGSPRRYSK